MPDVHTRDFSEEEEPSAKRQTLGRVSPLEVPADGEAPSVEEEGPSTPVDPALSWLADRPSDMIPQASYPAEERMRQAGLTAFCDALAFTGLRDELARFSATGLTILAPTDEAFARLPEEVRTDLRLVRQLLLGHMCAGTANVDSLKEKECAVAVAGQTHAVYMEDGVVRAGTATIGRQDLEFEGGVVHELTSVLMVLWLVRDSHTEQVWKKSLQPSPVVTALGGLAITGGHAGARSRPHGDAPPLAHQAPDAIPTAPRARSPASHPPAPPPPRLARSRRPAGPQGAL